MAVVVLAAVAVGMVEVVVSRACEGGVSAWRIGDGWKGRRLSNGLSLSWSL